jgi:hypothetical protein
LEWWNRGISRRGLNKIKQGKAKGEWGTERRKCKQAATYSQTVPPTDAGMDGTTTGVGAVATKMPNASSEAGDGGTEVPGAAIRAGRAAMEDRRGRGLALCGHMQR